MSAPDFSAFLSGLGGDGLSGPPPLPSVPIPGITGPSPLASTPIQGGMPVPQAPGGFMPSPLTEPQMSAQHGFDLQAAIGPIAAIALALSGHPNAATGAAHGAILSEQSRRQERERQQALQIQADREAAQVAQFQAQEAARRQAGIQQLITSTQAQVNGAKTKDEYDNIVNAAEALGGQFYGLRPNTIRAIAPYRAPNASQVMYDTLDKLVKNPANKQALEDGTILNGSINVDTDGDGKPDKPIPIMQAIQESGYPIQIDPTTQKPIVLPKKTTEAQPQEFATVYTGLVGQFQTDKGRDPNDAERGQLALKAIDKIGAARKQPPVNINLSGSSNDDTDSLAQMLVDGRATPGLLSKRASTYNATLARANKLSLEQTGRPINLSKITLDYEAAKRFVASMNSGQQVRFQGLANSVVNTIDEVKRLGNELKQGSVQRWNAAKRSTIQQVFGNTPQSELAAQYMGAVNTLKEEFAGLVQGGYAPTDDAFKLANQQVNADFGVRDLNASLSEVQRLINYRIGAFNDIAPRTIGGTEPTIGNSPTVAPRGGDTGSQPSVGSIVTLRDGRRVKVTGFGSDGSIQGTVVR